jgi:predicted permease
MSLLFRCISTFSGLLHRDRLERDMDAELRFHMAAFIDDQVSGVATPEEAKRRALIEFGPFEGLKEDCRQARGLALLDQFRQDLRYCGRMLRKSPGFAMVAIMTLAVGIGANTAIFSVVNSVLFHPLPYPNPDRLYTLKSNQSLPDLDDIRSHSQSFDCFGGLTLQALDYTGGSEPLQVQAGLVNADMFRALGVGAAIGRTISPEDDRYGGDPVVVLSDAFWRRFLNADPNAVGQAIPLSGNSYTVIGVMPAGFSTPIFGKDVEAWAALKVVNPVAAQFRGVHFLRTCLRLKPGENIARARAEFEGIDDWLAGHYPEENKGRRSILIPLHELAVKDSRLALLILLGAVTLVLLIACSNFANLLLARGAARRREMMIRAALGASRIRLIRQMLTESLILSLIGGAVGMAFARLGISFLLALKPKNLALPAAVHIDGDVLGFTLALSALTGIVFGLLPAIHASRFAVAPCPREGSPTSTAGSASMRSRHVLMASEVALALVLLIGAGLLVRGLVLLGAVDPGFDAKNLLTMRIELPDKRYKETPEQTQFRDRLLDGLNSVPGVRAAMVSELPLSGDWLNHSFVIEGRPPLVPGSEPDIQTRTVSANYFNTMRISLLKGRDFEPEDTADRPPVGLVNAAFVNQYFPDADPIGARISWSRGPRQWMTIVGVVSDVKHFGLDGREQPAFYGLYDQLQEPWKRWMYLVVRSGAPTESLLAAVKQEVWRLDGQIPLSQVNTMGRVIAASNAAREFNMVLMGAFALVALILAAVGIYGVISYSVVQRMNEFGVRLALGAKPRDLVAAVIKQGLTIAVIGSAFGVAAALALTRLMEGLLFGVSPVDPATFAVVTIVLIGIALLASYVPARRAARTDPIAALRNE